jgi:uncharacterized membrane protein YtjA (UPF0391 family)
MMSWVWVILALVLVAAILGFGGVVSAAAAVFKVFFWILLIIFIIGLVAGLMGRRRALV